MGKLEAADKPPKKMLFEKIMVPLSDREVSELGIKHAEARVEYLRLEKEKHEVDSDFNAKLKTLDAEQDSLARQVNARRAEIDVEVEEIHDDARKMVEVWRLAPRELLKTREMTVQEKGAAFTRKQPHLPGLLDGTDLVDAADRATKAGEAAAAKGFEGPDDEEPEPAPDEDDPGPIRASGEEEPPEEPRDTLPPPPSEEDVMHKGQLLRRVPRSPKDAGNGQPEAPKR